ncbi:MULTISPECIES: extracellular solute-binding protein [unclassified Actinomyces]|uniref:extracellular solute-binding protein n=1 Tax=unclassified Actinomyces TaxID=2609248 RepID=UPI0020301B49|nr:MULTISPECIES: extracellular solute-binding protein [unclassified Actinomyces]
MQDIPAVFQAFLGAGYHVAGDSLGEKKIFTGDSTFAQEWPEALAQWHRLYEEDIVGAESISLTGTQLKEDFLAGNLAMFITGPWDLADISASGLPWGIAPVPAAPGGETYATGAPDPGFAISSKAEGAELEAAKRLISFLASQEGLGLMSESFGALLNTSDYQVEVAPECQEIYDDYLKESKIYLPMNYWDHASDALRLEGIALFQHAVQGEISLDEVAAGMDAKLSAL